LAVVSGKGGEQGRVDIEYRHGEGVEHDL
jgi:hypothetical protein